MERRIRRGSSATSGEQLGDGSQCGFQDALWVGELLRFNGRAVDGRGIDGGQAMDGTVELVEGFALNHVRELRAHARERFLLLDDQDAVRFRDRRQYGVNVERTNCAEI